MAALSLRVRVAAVLALAAIGCARDERMPAEAIRLIAPPPGVLAPTYTLADETRPVLATPPERRLDLPVPVGAPATYTFTLPEDYAGDVVATGSLQKGKLFYALAPQLLIRSRDPDGSPRATLTLPEAAIGEGPAARLTLMLTTPPSTPTVESLPDPVVVPEGARLEVAFGLSPAAGIPGAAPVAFEIAVQPEDGTEQKVWSIALQGDASGPRWNEATVPLTAVAGRKVRLAFRARAAGGGRPIILPLWADPTIVAPAIRPANRRNVVLISIDTLRADRLEAYGAYRRAMPQIDAYARNAVTFTDAWSVWPETSGSHMSIFSSRFPSEHRVTSFIASPSPAIELLAERLRREGYLTRAYTEDGGVWANAGFARGFSAYAERRSADFVYRGEVDAVFADGTRWVDDHKDRAFFLFLHTYQVHGPYSPPDAYRTLFADVPGREPPGARELALAYDQEARYTDDHVGPFLAKLEQLGLRDRTIVIITSDHGEEFGDHGGMGHGRTLHQEVLRVPLVIAAPGVLAPTQVTTPTSLLDVAPTVLDLLGIPPVAAHRGVSLVARARAAASGAASDPAEAARPLFAEVDRNDHGHVQQVAVRRNHAAAITDVANGGVTRCYAADDRAELAPTDSCPELRELIELHRNASVPVGTEAPRDVTDPALIEKMRALGYIQ